MNSDQQELDLLIRQGESLTVEFKSDLRCLHDQELVNAVVSLANTDGGDLLLGVEDSGEITGLHPKHQGRTELGEQQNLVGLEALIANKTNPPLSVTAHQYLSTSGVLVARICVPQVQQVVATSEGLMKHRRLKHDGTPETVPLFINEIYSRQSSLGLVDPSAVIMRHLDAKQLDARQRENIRDAIKTYGGDRSLLALPDDELDGALGLMRDNHPTVAGLIMLGTESLLRQHLPGYEVAFQVLRGTKVQVNEFYRRPFLETFQEVEHQMKPWIIEDEIMVDSFRVPIPNYDRQAVREALVNAMVHRDFAVLGAVYCQLNDAGLTISNPGGFIAGVNIGNLLVASPRSRNPLLADVIKRIGLAERSGRGIDTIYEGMLRYGRPAPDYRLSNRETVSVFLAGAPADSEFFRMMIEQEKLFGKTPINALMILARLRTNQPQTATQLAEYTQQTEKETNIALQQLIDSQFVRTRITPKAQTYTIKSKLYKKTKQKANYVRQTADELAQQEILIIEHMKEHGSIKSGVVAELCHLTEQQAYRLLQKLVSGGTITRRGNRKASLYVPN